MRWRWVLFVLAAAVLVWLEASTLPSRALLALQIMDELREPGPGSWLQRATPAPRMRPATLEADGMRFAADVYEPAGGRYREPLLLVPGMVPEGKDEPRVPPFARALARAGFLVVVPSLPSFQSLVVQPANVQELAAAVEATTRRRDLAPRGRTGVFGVSFAGGIALLATLNPAVAPRISFLVTMGAYADLDSTLAFLATGRTFVRGRAHRVAPDPYSQLVFVRTYEQFLPRLRDRELLEAMAARRYQDPDAPLAGLADSLSPAGRLPYELFVTARLAQVPALLAQLPPESSAAWPRSLPCAATSRGSARNSFSRTPGTTARFRSARRGGSRGRHGPTPACISCCCAPWGTSSPNPGTGTRGAS